MSSAHAQLLDFDFSFTSDPALSNLSGYVDGTVTGEIIGVQNNAISIPTDIILTSYPSSLGLPSPNYSLVANGWYFEPSSRGIAVSNGEITSTTELEAGLMQYSVTDFFDLNYPFDNGTATGDYNGLQYGPFFHAVVNENGFTGATYTPVAAPEPSALLIGLVGVLAFFGLRRCRAWIF